MTTKRRRGFGTIRKMRSGRYQAEYTGPDLLRHQASATFTARAAAEGWLATQHKAIEAGTWRPPATIAAVEHTTVGGYAADWLATRPLKPRTLIEYRSLLTAKIEPILGDRPVASITPPVVRAWYAQLDPKTPTRRAHAYQLLRAILSTAVDDEIIPANPCRIRGAGASVRVREITTPTAAELAIIVEHTPAQYRAMVLLAAWCGLRFGELTALRRGDLNVTGGVVHVRRGAVRCKRETIIGAPKSAAGVRVVAIPPHVLPAVAEHLRAVMTGRDGLVFPTPGGLVMSSGNALNSWWHPARAAAGRDDLRFHDLRHHGGTLAAQAGATVPELQQRLGHSTVAAAMRYQHAVTGRDAEIARRLSALADGGR